MSDAFRTSFVVMSAVTEVAFRPLIPFEPMVKLWSQGLTKQRWLATPDGTTIHAIPDGDFDFPNGTVLVEHFSFAIKLVESRLLGCHDDGG